MIVDADVGVDGGVGVSLSRYWRQIHITYRYLFCISRLARGRGLFGDI